MTARVILVEATPRQASDGAAVTVLLAGGGERVPYEYGGNLDWRAGIIGKPTLIASLEFAGGEFPPGSVPAAAELEWQGRDLAELADLVWRDAPITVRMGPEGAALPPVVLSGQVLEAVTTREGRLKISLSDPAAALRKPLAPGRFAGTGGLEGPVEWDGRVRTRVWGRVWNLAGEPIDKANNIYCFADPLRQIQAIDAVRDKGAAAAALSSLAWQGSAAATFAALQASVPPQGGGVVCPSLACVKWWTQPAGDLCADLRGETAGGYVETTAQVIQRLVSAIGGPALAATELASTIAARPAPIGWVVRDEQTTVAAMLDELTGNSSLMWLINSAGEIVLRTWSWGASVASVQSHEVARLKTLRPVATRKIGYQRNELPMKRGDLAAIVLAEGVEYADGTPIEDLKPDEVGATNGAIVGYNIRDDLGTVLPPSELLNSLNPSLNFVGEFSTPPTQVSLGSAWKQNAIYKNSTNGKSYVLTGTPLAWQVYLEDGQLFQLTIESTNGTTFRVGQAVTTILKARLFKNGAEITDVTPTGWFRWRRVSAIPMGPPNDDATWNAAYAAGYRQVSVSVDDVAARATFFCDILSPT